jgi:hypothetical protein
MLLQSLRAPYLAPGGAGSIWDYLGAPARSTGVSGRFAYGFRTDLHFADVAFGNQLYPTNDVNNTVFVSLYFLTLLHVFKVYSKTDCSIIQHHIIQLHDSPYMLLQAPARYYL